MKVDFKIETWESVEIPIEKEAIVLKALTDGKIQTANDLIDLLGDDADYKGMIPEIEQQMLPVENDGQATIEFINDDGDIIFDNAE